MKDNVAIRVRWMVRAAPESREGGEMVEGRKEGESGERKMDRK